MRYDANLSRERRITLESIIDCLLGLEQESWIDDGIVWHRDDEYHAGILVEHDFIEFADALEYRGRWYSFHVRNALLNAIDRYNNARKAIGLAPTTVNDYEYQFLREELLKRFSGRLHRYSEGRCLAVNDKGGDIVGFRWE